MRRKIFKLSFLWSSLSLLNDNCKCSWRQPDDLSIRRHLMGKTQFLSKNINSHETNKELKTLCTPEAPLCDSQIIAVLVCSCLIFHNPETGFKWWLVSWNINGIRLNSHPWYWWHSLASNIIRTSLDITHSINLWINYWLKDPSHILPQTEKKSGSLLLFNNTSNLSGWQIFLNFM